MNKIISVSALVGWVAVASAGTPPAIEDFLSHGKFYKFDGKEWKFNENQSGQHCNEALDKAEKDGVADTLTVDVKFDTPLWKAGPHTVKELKEYCARAQKDTSIKTLVEMADMVGGIDYAKACLEVYDEATKKYGF